LPKVLTVLPPPFPQHLTLVGATGVAQLGNSTASTEEGQSDSDGDDENNNHRMNESE
jgi:hypothetical protein